MPMRPAEVFNRLVVLPAICIMIAALSWRYLGENWRWFGLILGALVGWFGSRPPDDQPPSEEDDESDEESVIENET